MGSQVESMITYTRVFHCLFTTPVNKVLCISLPNALAITLRWGRWTALWNRSCNPHKADIQHAICQASGQVRAVLSLNGKSHSSMMAKIPSNVQKITRWFTQGSAKPLAAHLPKTSTTDYALEACEVHLHPNLSAMWFTRVWNLALLIVWLTSVRETPASLSVLTFSYRFPGRITLAICFRSITKQSKNMKMYMNMNMKRNPLHLDTRRRRGSV